MSYRNAYYSRNEGSVFLRHWDKNGKRITSRIQVEPYLYVDTAGNPDAISLLDTPVRKIMFPSGSARSEYVQRNNILRSYENLPVHQQFLVDKYWNENENNDFAKFDLRTCFIDIEVLAKQFPLPEEVKYPISLITFYDTKTKKYYIFSHKPIKTDFGPDKLTFCFDNEALMLKAFVQVMVQFDFDIITGWNSDLFDIPYIANRITKLLGEKELNKLSPYGHVYKRQAENKNMMKIEKYVFSGIACVDYLDAYMKFNMNKRASYKLASIAVDEDLAVGKIDYGDQSIYDFQTTDWEGFVKYNIVDVDVLVQMDKKLQYVALLRELSYLGLANLDEALKTVPVVNGAICIKCRQLGKVMPTFIREHRSGKNIGAFVWKPRRGFVDTLITLDATSLYPSAIITMNLSPETKVGHITSIEQGMVYFRNPDGRVIPMSRHDFDRVVESNGFVLTKYGSVFRQDKKGIIPDILEKSYKNRKALKNMMLQYKGKAEAAQRSGDKDAEDDAAYQERYYDTKQNAIKTFMNSVYGYMGNKFAPMGDDDIANSITLTCQFVIKTAAASATDWVNENTTKRITPSNIVIYGDTDSIHISIQDVVESKGIIPVVDKKVAPEVFTLLDGVRSRVNSDVEKWSKDTIFTKDCRFEFKAEKVCYGGIYNEPKKYCLQVLWEEGVDMDKIKYTGLEVVKSTMPKHIKPAAKLITKTMIETRDIDVCNKVFLDTYKDFMTWDVELISSVTGIKNLEEWTNKANGMSAAKGTPGHVRAAIAYNKIVGDMGLIGKYEPIFSGDKIRTFYAKVPNRYNVKQFAFKGVFPKEIESLLAVDKDVMFEKSLYSYIKRMYNSCGWTIRKPNEQVRVDVLSLFKKATAEVRMEETSTEEPDEVFVDSEEPTFESFDATEEFYSPDA